MNRCDGCEKLDLAYCVECRPTGMSIDDYNVLNAAIALWRSRRPKGRGEAWHLKNPAAGARTDAERRLFRAVVVRKLTSRRKPS